MYVPAGNGVRNHRWLLVTAWLLAQVSVEVFAGDNAETSFDRGEYVLHAAGCASCHTDRKHQGETLAGGRALVTEFGTFFTPNITPDTAPNITPHRHAGIGRWRQQDLVEYLATGMTPEGDTAGDVMAEVIDDSLSLLAHDDLAAIAMYILSLPPVSEDVRERRPKTTVEPSWD